MHTYIRFRIDIQDPFLHNVRFIFSDCLIGRNNLTVQIRQTHLIIIDQIKGSNAASCQRLTDITTYTTDSEYGDTGIL